MGRYNWHITKYKKYRDKHEIPIKKDSWHVTIHNKAAKLAKYRGRSQGCLPLILWKSCGTDHLRLQHCLTLRAFHFEHRIRNIFWSNNIALHVIVALHIAIVALHYCCCIAAPLTCGTSGGDKEIGRTCVKPPIWLSGSHSYSYMSQCQFRTPGN